MLKNNKRVFWEALLLTLVVFILGLLLGISFENNKTDKINEYYLNSEISLVDTLATTNIVDLESSTCEELVQANIELADRIYDEALLLEKYEESGKLTENLKLVHSKYDVLRTFLWINTIKTSEKCGNHFNTVVYLYEYDTKDLTKKATQNVWSKVLYDIKQEYGEKVILIPIAVNEDFSSLDFFLNKLDVQENPAVIVNNKYVIYDLEDSDKIKSYLN